jgi:hypothetical protein
MKSCNFNVALAMVCQGHEGMINTFRAWIPYLLSVLFFSFFFFFLKKKFLWDMAKCQNVYDMNMGSMKLVNWRPNCNRMCEKSVFLMLNLLNCDYPLEHL